MALGSLRCSVPCCYVCLLLLRLLLAHHALRPCGHRPSAVVQLAHLLICVAALGGCALSSPQPEGKGQRFYGRGDFGYHLQRSAPTACYLSPPPVRFSSLLSSALHGLCPSAVASYRVDGTMSCIHTDIASASIHLKTEEANRKNQFTFDAVFNNRYLTWP